MLLYRALIFFDRFRGLIQRVAGHEKRVTKSFIKLLKYFYRKSTIIGSARHILTLFKKDLLLEIRQQYSFYGVVLYVISTIFVLYLAMGQPEAVVWKGLFWMIQLFISVNAVAKSFLQEGR